MVKGTPCHGNRTQLLWQSTALQEPQDSKETQGEGLVVPREQHLSLGARREIHGETTGCELANVMPAEEKREVEKGEMLPAATQGAHREAHDCECAHGDGALPWHEIRSQAGEPPALPSSSHLPPSPGWCLCLPHMSGRSQCL